MAVNTKLRKLYKHDREVLEIIKSLENKLISGEKCVDNLSVMTLKFVAPVVYNFIKWVLMDAVSKKLKTLYFLSRDGYIFYLIAEKIAKQMSMDIECRYLYCSRRALKIARLDFDESELISYMFHESYHMTYQNIISRITMDQQIHQKVLKILKWEYKKPTDMLTTEEILFFKDKASSDLSLRTIITNQLSGNYQKTLKYLSQEKLIEQDVVCLVDSGWRGSIQDDLDYIIGTVKENYTINGYYFGVTSGSKKSSNKMGYFFYENSPLRNYLFFNRNVFETFCSHIEGSAIAFDNDENGNVVPILNKGASDLEMNLIMQMHDVMLTFTESALKNEALRAFSLRKEKRMAITLLRELMVFPTIEMVETLNHLVFSDEVSDNNKSRLSNVLSNEVLNEITISKKIFNHIKRYVGFNINKVIIQDYWIEGSIRLSVRNKMEWYWYLANYYLLMIVRYGYDKFFRKVH